MNNISKKFKETGSKIVFTQDWHPSDHNSFASQHPGKSPFDPINNVLGIGPVLWPDHCVQGTKGSEFHSDLNLTNAHLIIRKGYKKLIDSYSCFLENDKTTETGLDGFLKSLNIRRVFMCGLALDYCVYFSAFDGRKKKYDIYVIHDLTRGIAEESTKSAINDLQRNNVKFIQSSELMF
ncbi:MAG: hypothetical protein HeimC3_03760 [Candidatus Heimdallarchaeota archaeon LC_3]|nr:MAG: hypothetical protein HeimC3_03760 [Candidatus Heimdallarchaeota archaeon LC_3]